MSVPFATSSPYKWDYITEPLANMGRVYENQQMKIVHGKSLGGSSMLNFMQYVRGNSKDFDEWEDLGNPGWNFKNVLPYFWKAEKFHNPVDEQSQDCASFTELGMRPKEYHKPWVLVRVNGVGWPNIMLLIRLAEPTKWYQSSKLPKVASAEDRIRFGRDSRGKSYSGRDSGKKAVPFAAVAA